MMKNDGIPTGVSKVDLSLPLPTEWREVGKIEKLFIYPLKSARGHIVDKAQVTKHGLKCGNLIDRQFMIVDAYSGKLVTARPFPKIVLIQFDVGEKMVTLSGPDVESLTVEIPDKNQTGKLETQVFGKSCQGYLLGNLADNWITNYIKQHHGPVDWSGKEHKMKIIFQQINDITALPDRDKHLENDPLVPFTRPEDVPIFADEYPVNLQTMASLSEVNQRLKDREIQLEIKERQFRPNILASGNFDAFSEDLWTYIKINDTIFRNARLCARCVFTTIDPNTGELNKLGEPLKTLKSFRSSLDARERKSIGDSPMYGIHLGVDQCGTIHAGDKILVGVVPTNWKPASTFKTDANLFYKLYLASFALIGSKIIAESIIFR